MRTRPFPIGYALARAYFERRRMDHGDRSKTHDALKRRGGMRAIAEVASSAGLVFPGSARFEGLASDVLRELPIEPGPEWLDKASTALELLLDTQPERNRP